MCVCLMKYNNDGRVWQGSHIFVCLMKYNNEMQTVAWEACVCVRCYLLMLEL